MKPKLPPVQRGARGFTLLELLVSVSILLVLLMVLLQIIGGVGDVWRSSTGKVSAFQDARSAFSTMNRTLARATLNTYNDYVDAAGNYRNPAAPSAFVPSKFARASELHFISGSADELLPGADAAANPGQAIFFQAPLGETDDPEFAGLNATLNSVGFYIQYGKVEDDTLMPSWLENLFASPARFRLMQVVQPTEQLTVYNATANPAYSLNWLQAFQVPPDVDQPRVRILAEDVPLLVLRPRLSPRDEQSIGSALGGYSEEKQGSLLSPNYHYDSRAWQTGYPSGGRVAEAGEFPKRSAVMRSQVPPIIDVAMVSVDPQTIVRYQSQSDTPPAELRVPAGLFRDSASMDQDLEAYGRQLSEAGIRYKIFRTSVQVQSAKWSNN